MEKLKVKLTLHPEVILQLGKFKNINQGLSDVINDYYLKGKGRPKDDGQSKHQILYRTYAYHKRAIKLSYTKEEFFDKFMNDKKFDKLYKQYLESNCDKQYLPTFKKAQNLEDIKVLPYHKIMRRKNAKPIIRDYYGEITEYQSINSAAKDLGINSKDLKRIISEGSGYRGDEMDKLYYK